MDLINKHAGVILYAKDQLLNLSYDDYLKWKKHPTFVTEVVWINIDNKETYQEAKALIDSYEFHPIILEYAQEENKRASLQLIDDDMFIVTKMTY
jgi:Mg2+ and Co2+ transporter CorA